LDDIKISRLQADVVGLSNTLNERDQYIRSLTDELSGLQSKNTALENQIRKLTSAAVTPTVVPSAVPSASAAFAESRDELTSLINNLTGLDAAKANPLIVAELEDIRLKRDVAVSTLAAQTTELASAKSQTAILKLENAELSERLLKETQAASAAALELGAVKQRTELSFTASQLAGYMSRAIDDFNHEANAGDLRVNYIINNMEVVFKASLTKNDKGEMTLAAPSLSSGDEALSSIKFNITAVPKEE